MDAFKSIINSLSEPQIMFSFLVLVFFFIFPPSDKLYRIHKKLRLDLLWTNVGGVFIFTGLFVFFGLGVTDENFRLIVTKPDNVPIVGLLFLTIFFLWLSMKQGRDNDIRLAKGQKPNEYHDPEDKVLVWPDLVYIELIAIVLCSILLMVWSIYLKAPLEGPANLADSPNPSKAPWYFLGLQEMLVYFDPWLAGVVLPSFIVLGLMSIPYIDSNRKGQGYYTFNERKTEISLFLFGWLLLWVFLIFVGTFLRGPNWNFFGPFEEWSLSKVVPLTNINLSELVYVRWLKTGLPDNIFLREFFGISFVVGYYLILPPLLARTLLKKFYSKMGIFAFSMFVILLLTSVTLPIKMYLRWTLNLKYIVAIPEFFFNI